MDHAIGVGVRLSSLVGGRAELCGSEATLSEAAQAMVNASTGSLGVIQGRDLVGLITERDLLRAVAEGTDVSTASVGQWMSSEPDTVSPDVEVEEAARWLLEAGYRHLPVMEDGQLLGIVSIRDLLWAILAPETEPPEIH
jgi:CBS domain-containing protein